ncbi:proline-rich receptor-like protein kinase PERK1 isoform X1 [Cryptomeria japonica]|uniref:proline-rich receptor-like protein kinase PERK1 isoform X1 n=1 Tax=Cryptomeria japonica TaxID=3369 RepID=UPI0025AB79B3|nr:proline-rich receptor-like protein kinase PERK1 isoform X1 [Cryptomeria japonica]
MSSTRLASQPPAHQQADPPIPSKSNTPVVAHSSPLSSPAPSNSSSHAQSVVLLPPTVTPTPPPVRPISPSFRPTSPAFPPPVLIPSTSSPPPSPSKASPPASDFESPSPAQASTSVPSRHSSLPPSSNDIPSPHSSLPPLPIAVPSSHRPLRTPTASFPSLAPHLSTRPTYPPDPNSGVSSITSHSAPSIPNPFVHHPPPTKSFPPFSKSPSGVVSPSQLSFPATRPSPLPVTATYKHKHGGISPQVIFGIVVGGLIFLSVVGFLIWVSKKRRRVHHGENYFGPFSGSFSYKPGRLNNSQSWPRSDFSPSSVQSPIGPFTPHPPPIQVCENGHNGNHVSQAGDLLGALQPMNETPRHGWGNLRSMFTYEQLAVATKGFSKENLLGEGGFGCVYKGCLQDGRVVAVKQLKVGGGQGEREFQAEVEIIGRVHHRHLVSLVGYSVADSQRLLIYDYVPNGNLEQHLHGKGRGVLDWATRVKIAIGAARGLAYLHEDCYPKIIHRDIKSSNILLDNNFEAQVSDFGLAKLATDTYNHVTTHVVGTFGYLAPEYISSGKFTERSDVYSYGVLLLELVTGRRPVDASHPAGSESLVEWARPLLDHALDDGNFEGLADHELENNFDRDKMFRMLKVAAACICHSAQRRPRMGQVVRALEGDSGDHDLNNGVKPGHSGQYDYPELSSFVRTFRMMAFGDQELDTGYSFRTDEYILNPSVSNSELQRSNVNESRPSRYTMAESHLPLFGPYDEHKSVGELEIQAINRPRSLLDDNW